MSARSSIRTRQAENTASRGFGESKWVQGRIGLRRPNELEIRGCNMEITEETLKKAKKMYEEIKRVGREDMLKQGVSEETVDFFINLIEKSER